jgi:RNA polymerase sigma-54 factor
MHPKLSLRIQTRIDPRLVMAGQMLRASGWELEELVRQEVDDNPGLELVVWENAYPASGVVRKSNQKHPASMDDLDSLEERLAQQETVMDKLLSQAALMVERQDQDLAYGILYSLDRYGYLRQPLDQLALLLDVEEQRLERVLTVLQAMDPPGIGARDLRECLSIQCAHLQAEGVDCTLPMLIFKDAWDEFAAMQWKQISRKVKASPASVRAAIKFIANNLYPYPLLLLDDALEPGAALFSPDLVIQRVLKAGQTTYHLSIPGEERYSLHLSRGFEAGEANSILSSEEREWIRERAERARVFITSLEQRWRTLRRIAEFLVFAQADFLERGPRYLKPLTQAEVAEKLGLHESTISRAISGKTAQLPDGRLRPLSDLFDASLPVKEAMREILSAPGRPLSDREMAKRLGLAGFKVARRTVSKYREQLHIPKLNTRGMRNVAYEQSGRANPWD